MVDACFRTLADGTRIFYPQGAFGRRGFVVESPYTEASLRLRAKGVGILLTAVLPLLWFACGPILPDSDPLRVVLLLAGANAVAWLATWLAHWPTTRRLQQADVPNSPIASWTRMGQRIRPVWLVLGALILIGTSGLMVVAWERAAVGTALGFLLLLGAVPYLVAIRGWWRGRTASREDSTGRRR